MPRLFGTNGVRGVVNEDMNIRLAQEVGMAIATFLEGGRIAIGTDTRTSNEMLKSGVISGLLACGAGIVDLGVVPTPTLQYYVKHENIDLGVIITASHNPPKFNGIKCADSDGTELSREKEEAIENIYFSKEFKWVTWGNIGTVQKEENATEAYIRGIMKNIDCKAVEDANLKIVLDCGNGAGSLVSPYLLERMGCEVITLNCHPQGTFPGHNSEPTKENLKDLMAATVAFGCDLGIAHDGDADRTIVIDEKGNYLFGDRILALVTKEMLMEKIGGTIVTTVASSLAVDDVVKNHGGEIIYTRVGSPIVARKMMETNALFGGEENGGLIFPNHQFCRDAAMAAAKIVEIAARQKRPFSEIIDELPKYHQFKTKITCPDDIKESALVAFAQKMEDMDVDRTDGVKIIYDSSWVLVRPSGTEPIYRIFAEADNQEAAEKLAEESKNVISGIISDLNGNS